MTNEEFFVALDYCYAQLHPAVSTNGSDLKEVMVSKDNLQRLESTLLGLLEEAIARGWADNLKFKKL